MMAMEPFSTTNPKDNEDRLLTAAGLPKCQEVVDLVGAGVSVNARDSIGNTPLHNAMAGGKTAYFLLEKGADVKVRNDEGKTPLHLAAYWENDDMILMDTMLSMGADVHARDNQGRTPLLYAKINSSMYYFLQDWQVNPHTNYALQNAFIRDAGTKNVKTLKNYIAYNEGYGAGHAVAINGENAAGFTALKEATRQGNLLAVIYLIEEAHAEFDKPNPKHTELSLAIENKQVLIAQYLVDNNACRVPLGLSSLRIAIANEDAPMTKFLLDCHANRTEITPEIYETIKSPAVRNLFPEHAPKYGISKRTAIIGTAVVASCVVVGLCWTTLKNKVQKFLHTPKKMVIHHKKQQR